VEHGSPAWSDAGRPLVEQQGTEARVAEVDAELAFLVREYQRRVKSPADAERFRAEIEGGRRDQEVAVARRRATLAAVDRCRSALARTRVVAPIDGVVLACPARAGEVAPPGSRLVTVCDLGRVRVEAEVDEFDAARIAPGDPVAISAEGHQGTSWAGTVEEVPDRVAERSVRPEDPGRPTDTRVLLVKIAPARPIPLKLGQRVELEIRPRR
jgi:multidrug resistance efflux pump